MIMMKMIIANVLKHLFFKHRPKQSYVIYNKHMLSDRKIRLSNLTKFI